MWIFKKKQKKYRLLLFIGSGRTGSTILGQIINYHPRCLVSNEFRLVQKVLSRDVSLAKALKQMKKTAYGQFKHGLENDSKYGKSLDKYQKKWIAFHDLVKDKDFKKQDIILLGDKKAGGNVQVYLDNKKEFIDLIKEYQEVYLLQIVRNPQSAALSYMKSHDMKDFTEACEHVIRYNTRAYELGRSGICPYYHLYYEDLLAHPAAEIKKIFHWLGLEIKESWLEKISQKINKSTPPESDPSMVKISREIIKKYHIEPLFSKYEKG